MTIRPTESRRLSLNGAIRDDQSPVAGLGEFAVVGDDDEGGSDAVGKAEEVAHDLGSIAGVEIAGRLVGEDDLGLVGEGARDGNPLLLSPTELGRQVVEALAETDEGEELTGTLFPILATDEARHHYVLQCAEFGEEEEALEDVAESLIAKAGLLLGGQRVDISVLNGDLPPLWTLKASESIHESGLPSAAGAAEKDLFSSFHGKVYATKDIELLLPEKITAVEVLGFDEAHSLFTGR